MIFESFAALVAFLAALYAAIASFIQKKMVDRTEMEKIQAESKKLSEEYEKAKKAGDKNKIEEITKRQMEFLPRMNKVMFSQFKPMIVVLGLFVAFTWVVGYFDPSVKDDIALNMSDNGMGCDANAGDGVFSACYALNGTQYGKWTVIAKVLGDGNTKLGSNATYFIYGAETGLDTAVEGPQGEPVFVGTDKQQYSAGETVRITASGAKAKSAEAVLDNGTAFRVDLPLTIPLLNVKTIWQPYWWFIFISILANLGISVALGAMKKVKK